MLLLKRTFFTIVTIVSYVNYVEGVLTFILMNSINWYQTLSFWLCWSVLVTKAQSAKSELHFGQSSSTCCCKHARHIFVKDAAHRRSHPKHPPQTCNLILWGAEASPLTLVLDLLLWKWARGAQTRSDTVAHLHLSALRRCIRRRAAGEWQMLAAC